MLALLKFVEKACKHKTKIAKAAQCRYPGHFWYELKPRCWLNTDPAEVHLVHWLTLLKVLRSQDGTKNKSAHFLHWRLKKSFSQKNLVYWTAPTTFLKGIWLWHFRISISRTPDYHISYLSSKTYTAAESRLYKVLHHKIHCNWFAFGKKKKSKKFKQTARFFQQMNNRRHCSQLIKD